MYRYRVRLAGVEGTQRGGGGLVSLGQDWQDLHTTVDTQINTSDSTDSLILDQRGSS